MNRILYLGLSAIWAGIYHLPEWVLPNRVWAWHTRLGFRLDTADTGRGLWVPGCGVRWIEGKDKQ